MYYPFSSVKHGHDEKKRVIALMCLSDTTSLFLFKDTIIFMSPLSNPVFRNWMIQRNLSSLCLYAMLLSLSSILTKCRLKKTHDSHRGSSLTTPGYAPSTHNSMFLVVCATLGNENLVFLKTAIYNMRVVKSNLPHISQQFYFRHFSLRTALVHFFWNRLYTSVFLRYLLQ